MELYIESGDVRLIVVVVDTVDKHCYTELRVASKHIRGNFDLSLVLNHHIISEFGWHCLGNGTLG